MLQQMFPLLIIVAFFIYLMWSQSKERKKIKTFRAQLQTGDEVVTAGGMYGTVKEVNESYVMLEIAQHVIVKIDINNVYPTINSANAQTAIK